MTGTTRNIETRNFERDYFAQGRESGISIRGIRLFFVAITAAAMIFAVSGQSFSETIKFSDVRSSDWFYESVMTLAGEGIVNGYADGTYRPGKSVTKAEALKMIIQAAEVSVREIEEYENWMTGIYEAAVERDIIPAEGFNGKGTATREEIAGYIVRAMDWTDDSYKENIFADTNDRNINILYTKDIVTGSKEHDGYYFYPRNKVTRAELSTLIVRLSNARKEVTGEIAFSAKEPMKDPECFIKEQPLTEDDFIKALLYMGKNKDYSHTFTYPKSYGLSTNVTARKDLFDKAETAYSYVFSRYPEYFTVTNKMHMSMTSNLKNSTLTLTLGNKDFSTEEMVYMQNSFEASCDSVLENLIAMGTITGKMTDVQKAKQLFIYVACNNKYDRTLASVSYTGYGATQNGTSVCQGYAAMFNMLCKKCGIVVMGITGKGHGAGTTEEHIWSLTMLDGEWSHTDVTYGDPLPDRAGRYLIEYFNVPASRMRADHTWDASEFPA